MKEDSFKIAVVARMKHGVLHEAIKKQGWTVKKAAEFLGVSQNTLCSVINLKKLPPFLFTAKTDDTRQRARELTEKLMELTGMTVEDLFPEAVRTDEFFDKPKVLERTIEIPIERLIGYAETLALPPSPDEELMEKEDDEEFRDVVSSLRLERRHAVQRVILEGKTTNEASEERGVTRSAISANLKAAKVDIEGELRLRRSRERINALRKGVDL